MAHVSDYHSDTPVRTQTNVKDLETLGIIRTGGIQLDTIKQVSTIFSKYDSDITFQAGGVSEDGLQSKAQNIVFNVLNAGAVTESLVQVRGHGTAPGALITPMRIQPFSAGGEQIGNNHFLRAANGDGDLQWFDLSAALGEFTYNSDETEGHGHSFGGATIRTMNVTASDVAGERINTISFIGST